MIFCYATTELCGFDEKLQGFLRIVIFAFRIEVLFRRLVKLPLVFGKVAFSVFGFLVIGFFVGHFIKSRLLKNISVLHDVQYLFDYGIPYSFEFLVL